MRFSSVAILTISILCAGVAAFLAKSWLENQAAANRELVQPVAHAAPKLRKVVVAAKPLRFGTELGARHLREVDWPDKAIPKGVFTSIDDLVKPDKLRIVLSAIETNEPVLKWKVTGPGQRASLSALIGEGMKAVTIRVNDVLGVAGFILPGDRVDILHTRKRVSDSEDETVQSTAFTDVIMQNIRVLAIDQLADDRSEKPKLAKAVTVEVPIDGAQKLVLAASVGKLSLALREAGETTKSATRRIGLQDLSQRGLSKSSGGPAAPVIGVTRSLKRTEYSVRRDDRMLRKPSVHAPTNKTSETELSRHDRSN